MVSYDKVHWQAPVSMVVAMLAGVILALGHHYFYKNLARSTIPNHDVLGVFSKQKLKISIGTAFAFLVKACFAFSLSIAYAQLVWRSVKQKRTKLSRLDALFSILRNATLLADYSLWLKYPLILSMALSIWLIPLAAVVTPATLTVETIPAPPTFSHTTVPMVDFSGLNLAFLVTTPLSGLLSYQGPQYYVTKTAEATAAQGEVLSLPAPYSNSSWTLDFFVEGLVYLGWTPSKGDVPRAFYRDYLHQDLYATGYTLGPLYYDNAGNYTLLRETGIETWLYGAVESWDGTVSNLSTPRIYVLAMKNEVEMAKPTEPPVICCELYNASYHAEFNFTNGIQNVTTRVTDFHKDVVALNAVALEDGGINPFQAYHANGFAVETSGPDSPGPRGVYNATIVRTLNYQSVFDAFGKILTGSIIWNVGGRRTITNTSILSTALFDTEEMAFFTDLVSGYDGSSSQMNMSTLFYNLNLNLTGMPPTVVDSSPRIKHLKDALEELFTNIVVSLMASKTLQPSPPYMTNVTQYTYHNVYIYAELTLWKAYGIATLITFIGVMIGLVAILSSNASYSTDFSTIVRATRHADLSVEIHSLDIGGQDPLPNYLAKSVMTFTQTAPGNYTDLQAEDISLMPLGHKAVPGETVSAVVNSGEEAGVVDQVRVRRSSISLGSESLGRTSGYTVA